MIIAIIILDLRILSDVEGGSGLEIGTVGQLKLHKLRPKSHQGKVKVLHWGNPGDSDGDDSDNDCSDDDSDMMMMEMTKAINGRSKFSTPGDSDGDTDRDCHACQAC